MGRYVKDGDGRPGGGNGKGWGKGALVASEDGDHLQGLHDDGDTIDGLGGDDNINGFSGNDTLIGGTGADDITTGQGSDTVDLGVTEETVYVGDGYNDTVNISVDDDPNDGTTDLFDTIFGYEAAEPGTEPGTFVIKDVVALDGLGDSINHFVEGGSSPGEASANGDIVDYVTATELGQFLWVDDSGQLVFDADGDSATANEDVLAWITDPARANADAGVTVRFEAEIEVVTDITMDTTAVQDAEYVAVWDGSDWLISIDGGDFIV